MHFAFICGCPVAISGTKGTILAVGIATSNSIGYQQTVILTWLSYISPSFGYLSCIVNLVTIFYLDLDMFDRSLFNFSCPVFLRESFKSLFTRHLRKFRILEKQTMGRNVFGNTLVITTESHPYMCLVPTSLISDRISVHLKVNHYNKALSLDFADNDKL